MASHLEKNDRVTEKKAFNDHPVYSQNSPSFLPSFTNVPVSLPVNPLLTTVQSSVCSTEESSTSDYESTCSDSSFHFRNVIMSPRVLSPDSQCLPTSIVTQKDNIEFDYDDSSDVSVDAYRSEPELAVNAMVTSRENRSSQNKASLQLFAIGTTAPVQHSRSMARGLLDTEKNRANLNAKRSDIRSESFRRWRKSTSDSANSVLQPLQGPTSSPPTASPHLVFPFGANKTSGAFSATSSTRSAGAKEKDLSIREIGDVETIRKRVHSREKTPTDDLTCRSLGRSTSLPLSLHVSTHENSVSGLIGHTSPCATPSLLHPGNAGTFNPGILASASSPSSCDLRRSRCPSSSSRCSASSPRPPSRIDQIKIEEATGMERDTLFERDVTLSSSLASSWEDLCLTEGNGAAPLNSAALSPGPPCKRSILTCSASSGTHSPNAYHVNMATDSGSSSSAYLHRATEPISISCGPTSNPTLYPIACSPSPTRVTKQCYSPSLQMSLNVAAPCPSPTGRRVFRRSLSPVTTMNLLRPSSLGVSLKRRASDLDSLDPHLNPTPNKRPAPEHTPPPPSSSTSFNSVPNHALSNDATSPCTTPNSPPPPFPFRASPVRCCASTSSSYCSPLIATHLDPPSSFASNTPASPSSEEGVHRVA